MKIKLFYYHRWDATTLEDFEKKINTSWQLSKWWT